MRKTDDGHQGAPGGLRLKFEPPRAARFLDPNSTVQCHIVQYNAEASARRARHRVFRGRKPWQENLNSQFGNPDGALFLPLSDKLPERPSRWRDATQSGRLTNSSDGSPWSRDNFFFPSPLQIREGLTIPSMPTIPRNQPMTELLVHSAGAGKGRLAKQGDRSLEFVFFDIDTPDNAGRSLPRHCSTVPVFDELHSQQPRRDPRLAQDTWNNGRLQRWRDATQSERRANCLTDHPGREAILFPPPKQIKKSITIPTMPIIPRKQPMAPLLVRRVGAARGRSSKQGDRLWEFVFWRWHI